MKYYVHYGGGKIYYSDIGEGHPIILLHGYLESSDIWSGFADKLARSFRVITVDLPGHGQSSIYMECHTMEFLASVIKGLVDCLNISRVFLAGHSLGGYITLAFLEQYPDLLSGYCLFHSHPFADSPETIQNREREIKIVRAGKKFLMYPENVSKMYANSNLKKFEKSVRHSKDLASKLCDEGIIAVLNGMIIRPSRQSVMEKSPVPCLWILGRMDNYIRSETIKDKVTLPSNARIVMLENSGHMGFVEEEDLSVKIMTDFVLGLS
jgi:pimeloyl-ACP methyl ester carboxylesterase